MSAAAMRPAAFYNAVWRWHFYAGLFCIPFVLWLSLTGTIYLWRPQIEGWLDRRYDHLAVGAVTAPPDREVAAALRAVPGAALHQYVLPEGPGRAVRILVTRQGVDTRVTLDPGTAAVLAVEREERRPFQLVFHLHGELLAGPAGSYLVEVAACWAIVMLLTGLYLWWPRGRRGLAGVLYPRLRGGGRLFWRDLHATAGLWVSLFALGLILTGLPWAQGWGSYLGAVRQATGTAAPVTWPIGGTLPRADAAVGPHAGHLGMGLPAGRIDMSELARVIATVRTLRVAPPVTIAPPAAPGLPWAVASDAADRPLRSEATVDGHTGRVVSRTDFAGKHWIDRAIGYGVAAHEGALFGLANQVLGTITALFLILLSVSGAVLWWRRRPTGLLGAPVPAGAPRYGAGLVAAILALGLYLPLFGVTLVAVLVGERAVLRRIPAARRWLGLRPVRV